MTLDLSTKESVLGHLQRGEMSTDAALAAINALTEVQPGGIYAKIGEKGGVSLYGLQRNPVTLYVGQWRRLLNVAKYITAVCDWAVKNGHAADKAAGQEKSHDEAAREKINTALKAAIPAPK